VAAVAFEVKVTEAIPLVRLCWLSAAVTPLGQVSHELRSPLTSIYSFSSLIADGLAGETSHEQDEYLQIILRNVKQPQAMIEDLLSVMQAQTGRRVDFVNAL
jgi:signal transduction histidine kinase